MKMNEAYQKAINRSLRSAPSEKVMQLTVNNLLELPLAVYVVSQDGPWLGSYECDGSWVHEWVKGGPSVLLPERQSAKYDRLGIGGQYLIFLNFFTGAFVAAKERRGGDYEELYYMEINSSDLLAPNDIGETPKPRKGLAPLPDDSPRILVGYGRLPNGGWVLHEQYWKRLPKSYSLGPHEKRVERHQVVSGIDVTSSQQSQLAQSLGVSVSAGWGPIFAAASSSMTQTSTTFQQVQTSTEVTSYTSDTYDNSMGEKARVVLYWQLTNVITIVGKDEKNPSGRPIPKATIVYGTEGPPSIESYEMRSAYSTSPPGP